MARVYVIGSIQALTHHNSLYHPLSQQVDTCIYSCMGLDTKRRYLKLGRTEAPLSKRFHTPMHTPSRGMTDAALAGEVFEPQFCKEFGVATEIFVFWTMAHCVSSSVMNV